MPSALSFSLTVHRVRWFDLLFKCARCANFTLLYYLFYRHIGRSLLKKCNCFAFSSSMKGSGQCLPNCFTFTLLLILKQMHLAHGQCRILNRFLVLPLAECHGFEALPDGGKSQRAVRPPLISLAKPKSPLWFAPNCNPSTTIRLSSVSTFNQMLANILNPKPDGFPLLTFTFNSICAILHERVDLKSNL